MLPRSLPNSLRGQLPELTGQVRGKDRDVGKSLPELGCSGRYGGADFFRSVAVNTADVEMVLTFLMTLRARPPLLGAAL
jgi:hypothetical protein